MSEFTPFEELVERERQRLEATRHAAQINSAQIQQENEVKRRVRVRGEQDKQDRIEYYTSVLQDLGFVVAKAAINKGIPKDLRKYLGIMPIGWIIDPEYSNFTSVPGSPDQRVIHSYRNLALTALKTDGTFMEGSSSTYTTYGDGISDNRLECKAIKNLSVVEVEFPAQVENYRLKLATF